MANTMTVTLTRTGLVSLEAKNPRGGTLAIEGSADLRARLSERRPEGLTFHRRGQSSGDSGVPFRPMEVFLASLAGCTTLDVISILTRQREPLGPLVVDVTGVRADAIPAVFTEIELGFSVGGGVDQKKLDRAVALSVEKYCSVRSMLLPSVQVRYRAESR